MSMNTNIQTTLVKASEVLNADIMDRAGHKIATIREVFMDPGAGQAHFAITEASGLLGGGGKYYPVPWSLLQYDADRRAYVAPFDKDRLKAGPAYDREQINSNAYGWDTQVQGYYAAP